MPTTSTAHEVLAELRAPVENCLNRESAALLDLPANCRLQTGVDELAGKCHEGQLTPAERSE